MHGSLMIYLFVGPVAFGGLANYIVPLQIGAPGHGLPEAERPVVLAVPGRRSLMTVGFLTTGGGSRLRLGRLRAALELDQHPGRRAGPVDRGPRSSPGSRPSSPASTWSPRSIYLRAPGMTMFRMPIFTWNMLVTGILILIAFPVFTSALVLLWCDRHLGAHIFEVPGGGVPVLWQDLFWFFGHPEVYILALPFFGIVTDVIAVFSRKPIFGYRGMVFATISIAALSTSVWAHHMFTTGVVLLPFFSLMSYLIAVPTGIKFFNWIGTMWRGSVKFDTPMLFCDRLPRDLPVGGVTRHPAGLAADRLRHARHLLRGRPLPQRGDGARDGRLRRLLLLVPEDDRPNAPRRTRQGDVLVHVHRHERHVRSAVPARAEGVCRGASPSTPPSDGFTTLNRISSAGSVLLFISVRLFLVNLFVSWWYPVPAGDNPWDAASLEWATTSPPPHHNFLRIPPVRSQRPVWDQNHPEAPDPRARRSRGPWAWRQRSAVARYCSKTSALMARTPSTHGIPSDEGRILCSPLCRRLLRACRRRLLAVEP